MSEEQNKQKQNKQKQNNTTKKTHATTGGILGFLYMLLTMFLKGVANLGMAILPILLWALLGLMLVLGKCFIKVMKKPPKNETPPNHIELKTHLQPATQRALALNTAKQLQGSYNLAYEHAVQLELARLRNEQLNFNLGQVTQTLTQEILSLTGQLKVLQEQLNTQTAMNDNLRGLLRDAEVQLGHALRVIQATAESLGKASALTDLQNSMSDVLNRVRNLGTGLKVGTQILGNAAVESANNMVDTMKKWDWETIGKTALITAGVMTGVAAIGGIAAILPGLAASAGTSVGSALGALGACLL